MDDMENELKRGLNDDNSRQYWLMKAEPESRIVKGVDVKFSIDDLESMPGQTSKWDGVRNYEARNFMRKARSGDMVLFYHSNCKNPGCAGLAKIVTEAYADYTAFDPKHPYYDPKSDPDNPRWFMVDLQFVRKFDRIVGLKELKECMELSEMFLIKRPRLSVQPVTKEEYDFIISLADRECPE